MTPGHRWRGGGAGVDHLDSPVVTSTGAHATGIATVIDGGSTPGVVLADPPPCPADLEGTDPVYVGRIRRDPNDQRAFWMWAVSDQLRKGAALNAIQIMDKLADYDRIP